ncbi:uncharacterized protein LOC114942493 [Nylanderia fulva]|uniref:uncharacterized protein LOC114942493 n=1 Tax=Nylanderia fulva TaxID=613905 RepID=UPI0010FB6A81|nr:uncharacterized protein LOC114942493 [Nylanderia fulva]
MICVSSQSDRPAQTIQARLDEPAQLIQAQPDIPRVERTAIALSRLLPNLGRPEESVRRLYAGTVHSMLLYGAPVWAEKLCATRKLKDSVHRVQRRVACRICRDYRTISGVAAGVLAGIPPAELLTRMYADIYRRTCELKEEGKVITDRVRSVVKVHHRRILIERWVGDLQNPRSPGRRTVEAVLPCFKEWLDRAHGGVTYRMTQVLIGQGCFGEYLGRIKRERTTNCHHCGHQRDDAEHTLEGCPSWGCERADLVAAVGRDLTMPTIVSAIVGSKDRWAAFSFFCERVISQKEEAERERERAGRNACAQSSEEEESEGGGVPPLFPPSTVVPASVAVCGGGGRGRGAHLIPASTIDVG